MLTSRAVLRSCLVVFSFAAPLAFVAAARADVACGDQTCPKNYECKAEPVACPDIACAPNDPNCTPPDCSGTVDTCVALPCTSDSDCADGMVCFTNTQEECPAAPTCAKGQDCPQPSDTACTSSTVTACVPKYVLPCETGADCGDGFSCEEEQDCACSGSAGSGSAGSGTPVPPMAAEDGGAPTPDSSPSEPAAGTDAGTPPPADCTCQPSGTKACNLKLVACSADSDCAAGFTCGDNPTTNCSVDSSGNSSCGADSAKICLPPYARLVSSGQFSKGATDASGNHAGSPLPTESEASGASTTPKASEDGGGCSIVPAPNHFGTSLGLATLALLGFGSLRRRRAR